MLIRSQDKTAIVVIEGIDSICSVLRNSAYFICSYNGSNETSCNLGKYKTEEEAIKIMDDICDRYQYLKECEIGNIGFENSEYVYYMPESGGEIT